MLSKHCWDVVETEFGGLFGHNFDLMAFDSNVQRYKQGTPLRHFTPYLTPGSAGVNVLNQDLSTCDGVNINAYVFPAFSMIPPLLRLLLSQRAVTATVVPCLSPLPSWWPILRAMSSREVLLACRGSNNAMSDKAWFQAIFFTLGLLGFSCGYILVKKKGFDCFSLVLFCFSPSP